MRGWKLTSEQKAEIVKRYQAGESLASLGRAYGVNPTNVFYLLQRRGIPRRPPGSQWRVWSDAEKQEMAHRYEDGESQEALAAAFRTSQNTVSRLLRAQGVEIRGNHQRGAAHWAWKGGRYVLDGYARVYVSLDHPFASMRGSVGYAPEHRMVMAAALGRSLRRDETVHHKNGVKLDNRPENLQLRHGNHGTGVRMTCLECGSGNIGYSGMD